MIQSSWTTFQIKILVKQTAWICSTVPGRSPWREPVWGGCWRQTHCRDIPKIVVFAWFCMAMAVSTGSPASSSEVRCEGCKSVVASVALLQCDWKLSIGCSHCWVPGGNSEGANVWHTHTQNQRSFQPICAEGWNGLSRYASCKLQQNCWIFGTLDLFVVSLNVGMFQTDSGSCLESQVVICLYAVSSRVSRGRNPIRQVHWNLLKSYWNHCSALAKNCSCLSQECTMHFAWWH